MKKYAIGLAKYDFYEVEAENEEEALRLAEQANPGYEVVDIDVIGE